MGAPATAAQAWLAAWGVQPLALQRVSSGDGQLWRVRLTSLAGGSTPSDLALRVRDDRPGGADALDAELDWLRELAASGLQVPRPLQMLDGRWRQSSLHGQRVVHATLMTWLPGRILYAGLRPVHLEHIGRLVAHLHDSTASRRQRGWVAPARQTYGPDLDAFIAGPPRLIAWGGQPLQRAVARAAATLQQTLADWPRDAAHWGWIHGDLHPWNLLAQREQAGVIDFGDAGWGYLAQDLAAVLQFLRQPLGVVVSQRPPFQDLRRALFTGYAQVRTAPEDFEHQVDVLHRLRVLNTLQWMLDDWTSPAQRPWGPRFLADLPDQLA
jgi:Ser/Thr protein kinase RdoA (MazF antagonist)